MAQKSRDELKELILLQAQQRAIAGLEKGSPSGAQKSKDEVCYTKTRAQFVANPDHIVEIKPRICHLGDPSQGDGGFCYAWGAQGYPALKSLGNTSSYLGYLLSIQSRTYSACPHYP